MVILLLSAANSIHTVRWANSLSLKGNEVHVLSCKDQIEGVNKFLESVKVHYLKYNAGIGYYLNYKDLKKKIAAIKPDVINVHYASGYGTLARLAKIKNYLLNVWGSDVYDFPNESKFKEKIIKKNLKSATYIASTSNCMAKVTNKYTDKNIFVTPFGVDINAFSKKEVERNSDKFILCTIKTLTPKYNIIGIIKAFDLALKKLKESGNDIYDKIEYHVYGSGYQQEEIEKLISDLGLNDKVFLKGYINNNMVPTVLNDCDIFLLNSSLDSESFGVSAVEAMACSKPVIASDVDGFKEVIVDGESGIIVNRTDVVGYSEKIVELVTNKELRDRLGSNARKRVEELYDWDRNVDEMISIYNMMLNN